MSETRNANREPRAASPVKYQAIWWDPHVLGLGAGSPFGLRRDDLISKDGDAAGVASRLAAYETWHAGRAATVASARMPSLATRTATELAADRAAPLDVAAANLELIDLSRISGRPFGPRFGTLVHAALATVPFDAPDAVVRRVTETQGRLLLPAAAEEEVYAAVEVVTAVLRHPVFDRVRRADRAGRCERELPILWPSPGGTLVEGTIDLIFDEDEGTTVIDFKTDRELDADLDRYRRQLAIYCRAVESIRGRSARGVLMRV